MSNVTFLKDYHALVSHVKRCSSVAVLADGHFFLEQKLLQSSVVFGIDRVPNAENLSLNNTIIFREKQMRMHISWQSSFKSITISNVCNAAAGEQHEVKVSVISK